MSRPPASMFVTLRAAALPAAMTAVPAVKLPSIAVLPMKFSQFALPLPARAWKKMPLAPVTVTVPLPGSPWVVPTGSVTWVVPSKSWAKLVRNRWPV